MVTFTPLGTGYQNATYHLGGLRARLDEATTQLSTQKVAQTYGGLGIQRGLDVTSRAKLVELNGYTETIKLLNVQFDIYNSTLQRMNDLNEEVKNGADPNVYNVDSKGRTTGSITAEMALREMMGLLNVDDGGSYLYAGRETQVEPVVNYNTVMFGTATRAGFEEVLRERKSADLGADVAATIDGVATGLKTGRLSVAHTATELTLSEVTNAFGFQLVGAQTTLSNAISTTAPSAATFVPPAVAHDELTLDFSATPPQAGDELVFTFRLPDGTETTIALTAANATTYLNDGNFDGSDADGSATDLVSFTETQASGGGLEQIITLAAADIAAFEAGETITITDPNVDGGQTAVFTFEPGADGSELNKFSDITSLVAAMTTVGFNAVDAAGDLQLTTNQPDTDFTWSIETIEQDTTDPNVFFIDPAGLEATLENIEATLLVALDRTAKTQLSAASSHRAAEDFFFNADSAVQAPSRVVIPTGGTAEDALELVSDTINTVQWYVGEIDTSVAGRDSFSAKIDPNIKINYGARANEASIAEQIRNLAVMTMETFDATNSNDQKRYSELASRVRTNLVNSPGEQSINQIQAEFAVMYSSIEQSGERLGVAQNTYMTFIQDIEGVDSTEVAANVVALETQLNASYEATSIMLSMSLLNYMR